MVVSKTLPDGLVRSFACLFSISVPGFSMSALKNPTLVTQSQAMLTKIALLRRRMKNWLLIDALALAMMVLLIVSLISLNLDFFFKMSWPTRVVQWLLVNTTLLWWLKVKLIDPLQQALPDDQLAIVIERHHPELDCQLVSAIQFLQTAGEQLGPSSPELMAITVNAAIEKSQSCDFLDCIDWRQTQNRLWQLAGVGLIFWALVFSSIYSFVDLANSGKEGKIQSAFPIWLKRNVFLQDDPWPKTTRLKVKIDNLKGQTLALAAGAKLDIEVSAEGVIPRQVYLSWEALDESLPQLAKQLAVGQATLKKRGVNQFFYSIPAVETSIRLSLWGGDDEFGPVLVHLVRRPWLRKLQLSAEFPAYTGLQTKQFAPGMGDIAIPEGSSLRLRGQASKPLQRAWLDFRAPNNPKLGLFRRELAIDESDPYTLTTALGLSQTLLAKLEIVDADQLKAENPTQLNFRVIADRPPKVNAQVSGLGNLVTPDVTIPLKLVATDDYGLTQGELAYKFVREVNNESSKQAKQIQGESSLSIPEFAAGIEAKLKKQWDLSKLKLQPGTFLSFWAAATDNDEVNKPKSGRSQVINLRVVTREQLMNHMIRRQAEQRRSFESLIARQEALRKSLKVAPESRQLAFRDGRKQLSTARQINIVARELRKIVHEMGNNKILEEKDRKRLSQSIIDPLQRLIGQALPQLRKNFERLGGDLQSTERLEATQQGLDQIIKTMKDIKAQMITLETMTELLTRLEKIVTDFDEILEQTRQQIPR